MRIVYTYLISIICSFAALGLSAQKVRSITTEDGLSQGFVKSVVQTKDGYIWASTLNGVNRYDGEQFKLYKHDPQDFFSIGNDLNSKLLTDSNRHLWVTSPNSIQYYDDKTDRFVTPPLFKKKPLIYEGTGMFDEHNTLWVYQKDSMVRLYSFKLNWINAPGGDVYPELQPSDTITYSLEKYGDFTAFLPVDTVVIIATDRGQPISIGKDKNDITLLTLPIGLISRIWKDVDEGSFWFMGRAGTIRINKGERQFFSIKSGADNGPLGFKSNGKTFVMDKTRIYEWNGVQLLATDIYTRRNYVSLYRSSGKSLDRNQCKWIKTCSVE